MTGLGEDDPALHKVYLQVYKNFVEGLDAIDNGVNQFDTDQPAKYSNNTHLSARVGRLNPRWNEESTDAVAMERFLKAVSLAGSEFSETVDYCASCWLPARAHVENAVAKRLDVDPSGEIIALEQFCPWKEHLYSIEEEQGISPVKFVLYEPVRYRFLSARDMSMAAAAAAVVVVVMVPVMVANGSGGGGDDDDDDDDDGNGSSDWSMG